MLNFVSHHLGFLPVIDLVALVDPVTKDIDLSREMVDLARETGLANTAFEGSNLPLPITKKSAKSDMYLHFDLDAVRVVAERAVEHLVKLSLRLLHWDFSRLFFGHMDKLSFFINYKL